MHICSWDVDTYGLRSLRRRGPAVRAACFFLGEFRFGLAERLEDIRHLFFHGWSFGGGLLACGRDLGLLLLGFHIGLWLTRGTGSGSFQGWFGSGSDASRLRLGRWCS